MGRLMVRHRDADDLARCPRAYVRSSARIRGTELPAPGLEMWRTVVDAVQAAHRAGRTTFEGAMAGVSPPGGRWEAAEQRAEVQSLIESYLDLTDGLGGTWVEPPGESVQKASASMPVVIDGRLWLTFDHGPDEVEVRKLEISSFHAPPDADALRTEFSTCVLTLLTHGWRPRPRLRFTLLSLRAGRAVSCVWDQDDLGLAREVVRSWVGERLGLAEFPATSNSLCPSCGHLGACPAIARSTNGHLSLRKAITGREGPEASIDADPWTVFSPSRWRTYLQCPRRYRNRHVLGLSGAADGPSAESGLGLAVHRVLAEVHDVDPLGHRGLEAIARRVAVEMEADPDEVATRAAVHLEMCPGDEYLGGELDLFCLDAATDTLVHGRVDALWASADGGIEVRDYKTGGADDELAAAAYAVLAAHTHPERRPVRVALEDLAEARLITREYGPVQLDEALERVRAAGRKLAETDVWPARPGPLCSGCPFRRSCPEAKEEE